MSDALTTGEFIAAVMICAAYASAVIMTALVAFAPEGWEDEHGFHFGSKDNADLLVRYFGARDQ